MNTTVATLVKREDASKEFSGVFTGDHFDTDCPRLEEINEVSVKEEEECDQESQEWVPNCEIAEVLTFGSEKGD